MKTIRILFLVVFYCAMVVIAQRIIFSDMHILAQGALIGLVFTACFFVRDAKPGSCITEITPWVAMCREEEIMDRELRNMEK